MNDHGANYAHSYKFAPISAVIDYGPSELLVIDRDKTLDGRQGGAASATFHLFADLDFPVKPLLASNLRGKSASKKRRISDREFSREKSSLLAM